MSSQVFALLFWGLMPFVFSLFLVGFVRGYLISKSLVDTPNERSSHAVPTPRGGGLGFMPILFIFGLVYAFQFQEGFHLVWQLLLVLGLCVVSWLDDMRPLSAKIRFLAQIFLTAVALLVAVPVFSLDVNLFLQILAFVVLLFGWVWFINLYNFMDGIDGITSLQTLALVIGLAIVYPEHNPLYLVIAGSVLGFLFWNSPPAKIFMGDVGSIGLGFLMGYFLISLALTGFDGFLQALILPLYYLADTTITLGRRILRKEKFWEAHREHFYQMVTTENKTTHAIANIHILICNVCLILCALWVPTLGLLSLFLALGVVASLLFYFSTRR